MKKYSKPSIEIIEMETEGMMAMSVSGDETNIQLAPGRRSTRGNDWEEYYN